MSDAHDADGPNVITDRVPALARAGYDHHWFEWSPLPDRPARTWPGNRRTAVSIVIDLGAVEWEVRSASRPRPMGGRGLGDPPDVPRMSHREFGHRVGIFRQLRILQEFGLAPAVALDVMTAEQYPALLAHVLPAASEVICGGLSASRPLTSMMTRAEESDYIASALDRLTAAIGSRPDGWLSPNRSESLCTPALLAEHGVTYLAEWANDDLPYRFGPDADGLWAYPLSWELSDLATAYLRGVEPDTWADSAIEAFEVVNAEGGRVFNLHLEPWLSGQAFRASELERVLGHLSSSTDAWIVPPRDVVASCAEAPAP